ncbi:MAG TPA: phenylalanine--tRNA ligase beta subunit-related protein [Vicinamibacteria bacterium]|nr:phenylalanine--tRNA ligase beta subunit-related protein [Vicinamibacteria bacterium]
MSLENSTEADVYEVRYELIGWELFFAEIEAGALDRASLGERRRSVSAEVRRVLKLESLSAHPAVSSMRRLFKEVGCDPSRYRPASEALLRRILKGEEIPEILPIVDLNNCLSAALAVPCCVMAEGSFEPPFVLRSGREGESYESLRGPFRLDNKPVLADGFGPCDAPITGNERVKVVAETERATLVAYLPQGVVSGGDARQMLEDLLSGQRFVQTG